MPPYKEMYYLLFNRITDVLPHIHSDPSFASLELKDAQMETEKMFIEQEEGSS